MISMEFEEMQKIWDEQKGETMYAINESALHKSVTKKKNAAIFRTYPYIPGKFSASIKRHDFTNLALDTVFIAARFSTYAICICRRP